MFANLLTTGIPLRTETAKALIANNCILELEDDLGAWYIVHPSLTAVVQQYLDMKAGRSHRHPLNIVWSRRRSLRFQLSCPIREGVNGSGDPRQRGQVGAVAYARR